jgi:type VI secretion system protein ImpH
VRIYVGDELEWELNLVLKQSEVPPIALGGALRLGWTTWLPESTRAGDADDLILAPARLSG